MSAGSFVLGVTATDADEGINRQLTYSLTDPDATSFLIDPRTGVITVRQALVSRTYNFKVKATDKVSFEFQCNGCQIWPN